MPADCLICLHPCPSPTVRCLNQHPMHLTCFTDMVRLMGKINCPYCSAHVPTVSTLRFLPPSRLKRACIRAEHLWYTLLLLVKPSRPARAVNRKLASMRLRFDNVAPLHPELHRFRNLMLDLALAVVPGLLLLFDVVCKTSAYGALDALRLGLAAVLLLQ